MNELQTIKTELTFEQQMRKDWDLVKAMILGSNKAKVTDHEFDMFMKLAIEHELNPFKKEIWCIKYNQNEPASMFVGRDGFLTIAHKNPQFDGIESGYKVVDKQIVGWCRVYRKDMSHPFYVEVYEKEYNTGMSIWKGKPITMIIKVAESQCLRKAFREAHGLYDLESENWIPESQVKNVTPQPQQLEEPKKPQNSKNKTKNQMLREQIAEYAKTNDIAITILIKQFVDKYGKEPKQASEKELEDFINMLLEGDTLTQESEDIPPIQDDDPIKFIESTDSDNIDDYRNAIVKYFRLAGIVKYYVPFMDGYLKEQKLQNPTIDTYKGIAQLIKSDPNGFKTMCQNINPEIHENKYGREI